MYIKPTTNPDMDHNVLRTNTFPSVYAARALEHISLRANAVSSTPTPFPIGFELEQENILLFPRGMPNTIREYRLQQRKEDNAARKVDENHERLIENRRRSVAELHRHEQSIKDKEELYPVGIDGKIIDQNVIHRVHITIV